MFLRYNDFKVIILRKYVYKMDIKNTYRQLTSIDIEEQKQIWDERGKGYYGEYLLFCELYKSLLGCGKILMNLNIPVSDSNTTEIDLLLIHETGLYVFEIKHYKGTIYGDDTGAVWTQYFRTTKNNTFRNPIEQNKYHIEALREMFSNTPIYSCIVFTNSECDIRVTNCNKEIDVCALRDIKRILGYRFSNTANIFSLEDIDKIFVKLTAYSQMQESVIIHGVEADFLSWVQPVIAGLENKKLEVEKEKQYWIEQKERAKASKDTGIVINVILAIVCAIITLVVTICIVQINNKKLAEFEQKFLHIDEIDNKYIDDLKSYVEISNVSLVPLTDDAVSFKARINMTNDTYGILITQEAKYIVMTTSGKVMEYDVFGKHLKYNKNSNTIGGTNRLYGDLAEIQFYGISDINDISYIKITEIELLKMGTSKTVIKDELEIELYCK